ncbi:NADH:ubiquinone oxidoreductase [Tulasnella sp. 419]|nr:NADH:ubiquinone oxidoreductase [Tulasnella sp. 419]
MADVSFDTSMDDTSFDDVQCRNCGWRQKYMGVKDLLAEARAELDDFQISSRELEEELEKELERTERAQTQLQDEVSRLKLDCENWQRKYSEANKTATTIQHELDATRQSVKLYKSQLVELEMGNDDLERNERAASASLADLEGKYGRVMEEKILLEQELLEKGELEEECQRLKDELRDMACEVTYWKTKMSTPPLSVEASPSLKEEPLPTPSPTPSQTSFILPKPIVPGRLAISSPKPLIRTSSITRTSSISSVHRMSPRPLTPKSALSTSTSASTAISSIQGTSRIPERRSKGIAMVANMRERTHALQMKIGNGLPRLRLNSLTGSSLERRIRKRSNASPIKPTPSQTETEVHKSPGWVLVQESMTESMPLDTADTPRPPRFRPPEFGRRTSIDSQKSCTSVGSLHSPPPSSFNRVKRYSDASSRALSVLTSSLSSTSTRPPSRLSISSSNEDGTLVSPSSRDSSISSNFKVPSGIPSRPATPSQIPTPPFKMKHKRSQTLGFIKRQTPSPSLTHVLAESDVDNYPIPSEDFPPQKMSLDDNRKTVTPKTLMPPPEVVDERTIKAPRLGFSHPRNGERRGHSRIGSIMGVQESRMMRFPTLQRD